MIIYVAQETHTLGSSSSTQPHEKRHVALQDVSRQQLTATAYDIPILRDAFGNEPISLIGAEVR